MKTIKQQVKERVAERVAEMKANGAKVSESKLAIMAHIQVKAEMRKEILDKYYRFN